MKPEIKRVADELIYIENHHPIPEFRLTQHGKDITNTCTQIQRSLPMPWLLNCVARSSTVLVLIVYVKRAIGFYG